MVTISVFRTFGNVFAGCSCYKPPEYALMVDTVHQLIDTTNKTNPILVSPIFPLIISSAKYPPVSNWSNRPSYLRGRQQLFMGVLFVHWALS